MANVYQFDPQKWAGVRQDSYSQKLTRMVLSACGVPSTRISLLTRQAGDEGGGLNLAWFNRECGHCPLAIESRRLDQPIDVGVLFRKNITKNEFWSAYCDARQNWDRPVGMVFDCHGDGVGDLILHNHPGMLHDDAPLVRFYAGEEAPYFIQPFPAFLSVLGPVFRPLD